MLTFCEHTVRAVCAELEVELVEFNGEADHVHLLVAYPPTLAISNGAAAQRSPSTPTLSAGPRLATNGMGLPRTEVRGLRPRSSGQVDGLLSR